MKINRIKIQKFTALTSSLSLILFFQNCVPSQFQTSDLSSSASSSGSGSGSLIDSGTPSGSQPEPGKGPPALPAPVAVGAAVTEMKIESTTGSDQTNVPVTFGQVFSPGALLSTETVAGKLSDGTLIALQVEEKAKHDDGSLRHAIISAVIPKLSAGQKETLSLVKASKSNTVATAINPSQMMAAGFGAVVSINLGGTVYTASPDSALKNSSYQSWLSGPLVNEWLVAVPFKNSQGVAHPHLTARFDVRSYTGLNRARVDFIIENNWAYEPNPQNFTYDIQMNVGGQVAYTKAALTHYTRARFRKSFWWGQAPQVHVGHNARYLMLTRAVPNYDPSIVIPENRSIYPDAQYGGLVQMKANWTGARTEPMATGFADPAMPGTGGRADIGLLPGWAVKYLISQDARAKEVTLGTADLAGSFPVHFRDQKTDLPLSVVDWPYASLLGNPGDLNNPKTGKNESFPTCAAGGNCASPNEPDSSHQPNLNYLPYLVTGDHYQLEELQFYAMFNITEHNPYYREFEKGLVKPDQMRGQAWAMRTLGDAAYITPDSHPLKAQFLKFLDNNLEWYNTNYTNNPSANSLGITTNGYTLGYNDGRGLAPWQDDFFTQAIGHLVDLGFKKAEPLLKWKAKFSIGRMTEPGFCWISAANYSLNVRDNADSPFYTSFAQVYQASLPPEQTKLACNSAEMAAYLNLKIGQMTGYADGPEGYPSNMQPALAYAATSGAVNGSNAWQIFSSRSVQPDYAASPQFGIVPRQ